MKNKTFWLSIVPAVLLLAQTLCNAFGINFDFSMIGDKLIKIIEAVFMVLAILGIVVDPTTAGVSDSAQAMTYETPKERS